jgi:hypothetical protein
MAEAKKKSGLVKVLRTVYLYLVSLICVVVFIIGSVTLINTALKTWVFPVENWGYSDPAMSCNSENMKSAGLTFKTTEECVAYYDELDAKNYRNQLYNDISFGISMTTISLIIWLLHMSFIKKDKKEND